MTRVKRGVIAHKHREKLLKYAKGFRWGRKSKERLAKDALLHAWSYSFHGRKLRKRDFRKLWQTKISAAVRQRGTSYSAFIAQLKKKKVILNRKMLSEIAERHPQIFEKITEFVK